MVSDLEKAETSSSARLRPEYAYSWQGQAYQGGGEEAKQAAQAASAVQGLGALEVRWFIQASRIARISSSQLELLVNQDDFLLLGSVSCPWDGLSEGGWQICGKSQKLEAIIMNKWEDVGNKPSVSPTATPFFTSALKGYLQVCPRKQARAALALQCESANIERLSEPRCGRTMEHGGTLLLGPGFLHPFLKPQEAVKPVHSHFHVQRPSPLPEAALSFVVLIHLLILSRVQATDPLTKCLGQLRKSGLPDRAGAREKQTVPFLSSEHHREPKALASVSTPVPKSCLVGFPTTWDAAHIAPHCSPHTCEEGSVTFSIWGGIKDHNKPVQKPVGAPGASVVLTCLDVFTAPPPAACLQQRITTTQYGYFQGRFEVMTSHMGDDLTHG
ncbi:hypothetical protein MG293_019725 [Ovis ammon polii]|uniref:Uncharacterized protein n=1 Tax=Ovis ammon polii TaxID=230172 RepID=A0AAD4XZX8_OVIAM|nr:hypothetical protein MG293_019725 [Ovis ammon polii]